MGLKTCHLPITTVCKSCNNSQVTGDLGRTYGFSELCPLNIQMLNGFGIEYVRVHFIKQVSKFCVNGLDYLYGSFMYDFLTSVYQRVVVYD